MVKYAKRRSIVDRIKDYGRISNMSNEDHAIAELLNIHEEAIRLGDVPQELKDRGVHSAEFAKTGPMDKLRGAVDRLQDSFDVARNAKVAPMEEFYRGDNMDMDAPENGQYDNQNDNQSDNDMSSEHNITNERKLERRPDEALLSMDQYEDVWVDRFSQTTSSEEREALMSELQDRKQLNKLNEGFSEKFANERDPEKRAALHKELQDSREAYTMGIPLSEMNSNMETDGLGSSFANDIHDLGSNTEPAITNDSAVELSSSDIDDLSVRTPSYQL